MRNTEPGAVRLAGVAPLLTSPDNPLPGDRRWTLDLERVEWVTPFDATVLALEYRRATLRGARPHVSVPLDEAVRNYAVAVGLPEHVPGRWREGSAVAVHPPLVPLHRIDEPYEWDDLLEDLWPRVRAQLGDPAVARRMFDILGELVDNAATHGWSRAGVFVCAQIHTGTTTSLDPGIWVAVADGGVGIPEHLRRNARYASIAADEELLALARKPGVTGTADRRGYGLWETLEAAAAIGSGQVMIRSGNAEARFWVGDGRVQTARYRTLSRPLCGTWVHGVIKP